MDRRDFLDNMMVLRKRGQEAKGAQNVVSEYLNLTSGTQYDGDCSRNVRHYILPETRVNNRDTRQ